MKKSYFISVVLVIIISTNTGAQSISWDLPFLPITLTYDWNSGLSLSASTDVVTPIGVFELSSGSYNLSSTYPTDKSTPIVSDRIICNSPTRAYSSQNISHEKNVVRVPVYKTIVKEVIVKEEEYVLVLRDRNIKKEFVFLIKGVDELEAVIEGKVKIIAKKGQVIVDITDAYLDEIKFKGRVVENPQTFTDKVYKLCHRYNQMISEHYKGEYATYEKRRKLFSAYDVPVTQSYSFWDANNPIKEFNFRKDFIDNPKGSFALEDLREHMNHLSVKYNKYEIIAAINQSSKLENCRETFAIVSQYRQVMLICEDGIYWTPIHTSGKGFSFKAKAYYDFISWQEFKKMTFKKIDDCTIKFSNGAYFQKSALGMNSQDWVLYFEDLQQLVSAELRN